MIHFTEVGQTKSCQNRCLNILINTQLIICIQKRFAYTIYEKYLIAIYVVERDLLISYNCTSSIFIL